MGIVMGDTVGHRCWSQVMGFMNTSDQDAKIFRSCDCLRGWGESVIRVVNVSGLRSNSNPDGRRSETRSKVRDGDDVRRLCLGVECVSVK
jgi:hypothetical protein